MAKTSNIGLNLTTDETTQFKDWRKSIDGENNVIEKSNMQIIDEEIGNLKTNVGNLSKVATSGNYNDLSNLPNIPTVYSWATQPQKPSYSYDEIKNTPSIPTHTSQLTNNSGFVTNQIAFVNLEELQSNNDYSTFLELSKKITAGEMVAVVKLEDKEITITNVNYNDSTNTAIWTAVITSETNVVQLLSIELINYVINYSIIDYSIVTEERVKELINETISTALEGEY